MRRLTPPLSPVFRDQLHESIGLRRRVIVEQWPLVEAADAAKCILDAVPVENHDMRVTAARYTMSQDHK
jgi:hypothetical protein